MDINVDVGLNITSMLERLAQQIGTTADKVFPWYVHQAYLEGITTLCALGVFWLLAITLICVGLRKADFDEGNRHAVITGIGCALAVFVLLPTSFDGTTAVRQILNPNYYAMKMLTSDIGKLTRK